MSVAAMIMLATSVSIDVLLVAVALGMKQRRGYSFSYCPVDLYVWTVGATSMLLIGWWLSSRLVSEWLYLHHLLAGTGITWIGITMMLNDASPPDPLIRPTSLVELVVSSLVVSVDVCVLGAAFALKRYPIFPMACVVTVVTASMGVAGIVLAGQIRPKTRRAAEISGGALLLATGSYAMLVI